MNTRRLIALGLLGSALFAAGFWSGWHRGSSRVSTVSSAGRSASSEHRNQTAAERADSENQSHDGSARLSPEDVVAKVQTIRGGAVRSDREWRALEEALTPADIPKVLEAVKRNPSKDAQRALLFRLLSFWGGSEPAAALAYANGVVGKQEHEQAVLAALNGWAEKEPQAALAWVRKLPSGQLRIQALNDVIQSLCQANPQAAFDLLQKGKQEQRPWGTIFEALTEQDPAAAVAKAAGMSAGVARSEAIQSIASVWVASTRRLRWPGPRLYLMGMTSGTRFPPFFPIGPRMMRKPRWPGPGRCRKVPPSAMR
jgi:hypothetical protein